MRTVSGYTSLACELKGSYENTQHTPNPEAQFPSAVPVFEVHSVTVKQVPVSPDVPVQTLKKKGFRSVFNHCIFDALLIREVDNSKNGKNLCKEKPFR